MSMVVTSSVQPPEPEPLTRSLSSPAVVLYIITSHIRLCRFSKLQGDHAACNDLYIIMKERAPCMDAPKTMITLFKEYYNAFMFIHHNIHYARSYNNNIQHSYWCSTPWSHPWGYSLQLEDYTCTKPCMIKNIIPSILGRKSLKFDLTLNADGPK